MLKWMKTNQTENPEEWRIKTRTFPEMVWHLDKENKKFPVCDSALVLTDVRSTLLSEDKSGAVDLLRHNQVPNATILH